MSDHVRHVTVNEHFTWQNTTNFIRRHTTVAATDPKIFWRLLPLQAREEARRSLFHITCPSTVALEKMVKVHARQCRHTVNKNTPRQMRISRTFWQDRSALIQTPPTPITSARKGKRQATSGKTSVRKHRMFEALASDLILRQGRRDQGPESGTMVHFTEMRQFVNHNVIDDIGVEMNETPMQSDGSVRTSASPTRPRRRQDKSRHPDLQLDCKILYSRFEVSKRILFEPWRQKVFDGFR